MLQLPILWRYLITEYLKVFLLSLGAFLGILLVLQAQEIAQIASLGATVSLTLLFTAYQIIFILPLVIPISSLLATWVLFSRLSDTFEITSLRACGLSFRHIMTPIILVSIPLSLFNFVFISEYSTSAHKNARQMKNALIAQNPLLLLKNQGLIKIPDTFIHYEPTSDPYHVKNVFIGSTNRKNGSIHLIVAKDLKLQDHLLYGDQISYISSQKNMHPNGFDNLVIDNQEKTYITATDISQLTHKSSWKVNHDHLRMGLLLSRVLLNQNKLKKEPKNIELLLDNLKCYSDILRRISIGICVTTLTIMGACFACYIGRNRRKTNLIWTCFLSIATLISILMGKTVATQLAFSCILYLVPHLIIMVIAIKRIRQLSSGKEV